MKIVWVKLKSGYVTDLRSVTLWGAICWGIRFLFGNDELNSFIERGEKGSPDFIISSAFPFKQQGKKPMPFFPNPLRFAPGVDGNEDVETALVKYRLRKKLKDILYLPQSDFEDFLHGRLSEEHLFRRLEEEQNKREEARMEKREYFPDGHIVERTPPRRHDYSMTHNTIDRLRGGTLSIPDAEENPSGQLFHADDIWWSDPHDETPFGEPKTGLFFLVEELAKDSVKDYLAPVLRFLEHWGIGADRTTGKGFFQFEIEDFSIDQPSSDQSGALLNLSLLLPTFDELNSFEKADGFFPYSLENRDAKGWSEMGAFIKKPCLFYTEGSVFKRPEGLSKNWLGQISENLPDSGYGHRVLDFGLSLMVNLKWNEK